MSITNILSKFQHNSYSTELPEGYLTFLAIEHRKRLKKKSRSSIAFYKILGDSVLDSKIVNMEDNVPTIPPNAHYTITSQGKNLDLVLTCEYEKTLDRLFSTVSYREGPVPGMELYPIRKFGNAAINLVKITIGPYKPNFHFCSADIFFLRGSGILTLDSKSFKIAPAKSYAIPANKPHHFSPMSDIYFLSFTK